MMVEPISWLLSWPTIPQNERTEVPRGLYINETVPEDIAEGLLLKGWLATDVRLIKDPIEALKATLAGIRAGSIVCDASLLKFIDLEARALGLVGSKKPDQKQDDEELPMEELLGAFTTTTGNSRIVRRPGRPNKQEAKAKAKES